MTVLDFYWGSFCSTTLAILGLPGCSQDLLPPGSVVIWHFLFNRVATGSPHKTQQIFLEISFPYEARRHSFISNSIIPWVVSAASASLCCILRLCSNTTSTLTKPGDNIATGSHWTQQIFLDRVFLLPNRVSDPGDPVLDTTLPTLSHWISHDDNCFKSSVSLYSPPMHRDGVHVRRWSSHLPEEHSRHA